MAHSLTHNTNLRNLSLNNCKLLDDTDAVHIAQALQTNTTLLELHIANMRLKDAGVSAISDAIMHNTTLTKLSVADVSMTDTGVVALVTIPLVSSTIRSLSLVKDGFGCSDTSYCVHKRRGAKALAMMLSRNIDLEELRMCRMTHPSAQFRMSSGLAEALRINPKLHTIHLSFSNLRAEDLREFIRGLYTNVTLKVCIRTYVYMKTCTNTYVMHAYIYIYIYIYIFIYIHTHIHTLVYMHIYMQAHIHTYLHIHTDAYIHTYTHKVTGN